MTKRLKVVLLPVLLLAAAFGGSTLVREFARSDNLGEPGSPFFAVRVDGDGTPRLQDLAVGPPEDPGGTFVLAPDSIRSVEAALSTGGRRVTIEVVEWKQRRTSQILRLEVVAEGRARSYEYQAWATSAVPLGQGEVVWPDLTRPFGKAVGVTAAIFVVLTTLLLVLSRGEPETGLQ